MNIQEINEAKKMYLEGKSLNYIGKILGYHSTTIKRNLIKTNIKIRTRSEQNILSNMMRKKQVDDNYFDKIDLNQAWLVGFIAADGTIRKNRNSIKIGLSTTDREILEKIKKELKIEKEIFDYCTNNGFQISELEWTSKKHKDFLAKYNIVNNKTYLPLQVPKDFTKEQQLAFILGYFDGDGSISIAQEKYLRFRICSHRIEILESIANSLDSIFDIKYSINKDSRRLYELNINNFYSNKIFKKLYELKCLHLNRKYQKFLEYNKTTRSQHL